MFKYIEITSRMKDITGKKFGRLVAIGPVARAANGHVVWRCVCDCGKSKEVQIDSLQRGITKSCGCLRRDCLTIHGMAKTNIYDGWHGIINRCTDPSNPSYVNYGGRGITICDEWRHDFRAFYDYVSQLPDYGKKGYTLDRIDNDGNYCPKNVQWASRKTQSRNTRRNIMLTHNGKTQCVADWANELGISRSTLSHRLRCGWSAENALTQPVRVYRNT